jgi:hypothetical protein
MISLSMALEALRKRHEPPRTCGNCKSWGKPDEADLTHRTCTAIIHDRERYTSNLPWVDYEEDEATGKYKEVIDLPPEGIEFRKAHPVVVADGSGYMAALKPREDFGCTLFEAKA